jgi:hypothetical protein
VSHARSHDGQGLFHLLNTIGLTLDQWISLDPRQAVWYAEAYAEDLKRQKDAQDKMKREHRAKQLANRGRR